MFIKTDIGLSNQKSREIWLEKTLKKIPRNYKILDVGAGEQQYKRFCSHLKYISQDSAKYDGHGNGKGKQTNGWNYGKLDIVSDIAKIPLPDKSLDAIMCIEVLEHVPDPISAIKEFSRLLKKNGYLIITAPFGSLTHFSPYHFYSGFSKYFYEKFLPKNRFKIEEITPNGDYFQYLAQEVRRAPAVADKYAKQNGIYMKVATQIFTDIYLFIIARFTNNCKQSAELLCFGYHIFASKK